MGREFDYSTPFSSEIKNGWNPQLCSPHILSQRGQEHCFCSVTIFAPSGTLKSIIFTVNEIKYYELSYWHIYIYIYIYIYIEGVPGGKCGLLAVPRTVPVKLTRYPYTAHVRP
jgi:hypothetical protein